MFEKIIPVGLTARAASEVRKIMDTKNIPADYGLRIGIRGGGCGGVALIIGFDKTETLRYDLCIRRYYHTCR